MARRKLAIGMMAGVALALASMSAAWACGSFQPTDMTLGNATDEPWDGPGSADVGKNWSDCAIGRFATTPHGCGRPVTVEGKNFENSTETKLITRVKLYWVDEPFYAAGLGGPNGPAEQLESKLCVDKGVLVGEADVTNKTFKTTTTMNVPPTKNTTTDGTYRVGATELSPPDSAKFYYGLNAICAVWDHESAGFTHQGSIGNGYNIYF